MPDYELILIEISRMQRAALVETLRRARGTYDEKVKTNAQH